MPPPWMTHGLSAYWWDGTLHQVHRSSERFWVFFQILCPHLTPTVEVGLFLPGHCKWTVGAGCFPVAHLASVEKSLGGDGKGDRSDSCLLNPFSCYSNNKVSPKTQRWFLRHLGRNLWRISIFVQCLSQRYVPSCPPRWVFFMCRLLMPTTLHS